MPKHLLAVAAVAMLVACGGGSGSEPGAVPQAVAQELRAKAAALRANGITPQQAAIGLMNYAEWQHPQYFPRGPYEQTSGPFLFRYYFGTRNYLGVVVSANESYALGGVYVVGPSFGRSLSSPMYVGQVGDFIDTSEGASGGTSNGCFDLAAAETPGTRTVVSYRSSGSYPRDETVDTTVGEMTTFEGNPARETTINTTGSTRHGDSGNLLYTDAIQAKSYGLRTGEAVYTSYGMTSVTTTNWSFYTTTDTKRTVYSPSYVDTAAGLAQGQAQTAIQAGSTRTAGTLNATPTAGSTSAFNRTYTNTYVGRETITVAAGTYESCRFIWRASDYAYTITTWYMVGRGIPVKVVHSDSRNSPGSGSVREATAITLNGAPL